MKLNIGCGKIYKEGFVNIDAYDPTVADTIMQAEELPFSANSIEKIEACQLIEHFGLFKAIYVLSEWFRILKPNGILILETPDIKKSFEKFLNGNLETKKNVMTWIYGLESQGMTHKFCFPEDLLETTLKKTGFVAIKKTYFEAEKDHPTMRIECKKIREYKVYQAIAEFRKKLFSEKIIDTDNYYRSLGQEELNDYFIEKINEFYTSKNYRIIDAMILEGAVQSVITVKMIVQECIHQRVVDKNKMKKYVEVLDFLDSVNFQTVLFHLIKESSTVAGSQLRILQTINGIGKESVKQLVAKKSKKNTIKSSLKKLSKRYPEEKIIFLSEKVLEQKSSDLVSLAVKEFILGNLNASLKILNESITLERNCVVSFVNRAKIYALKKDFPQAQKDYESAIQLMKRSDHREKKKIVQFLQQEKESFSKKNHGKPINQIEDLLYR